MAEFPEYEGFNMNAIGNPMAAPVNTESGGAVGEGPVGNTRPAGIVALGNSVSASQTDSAARRGRSVESNKMNLRRMSSRR